MAAAPRKVHHDSESLAPRQLANSKLIVTHARLRSTTATDPWHVGGPQATGVVCRSPSRAAAQAAAHGHGGRGGRPLGPRRRPGPVGPASRCSMRLRLESSFYFIIILNLQDARLGARQAVSPAESGRTRDGREARQLAGSQQPKHSSGFCRISGRPADARHSRVQQWQLLASGTNR